jgi:hypothetical protein
MKRLQTVRNTEGLTLIIKRVYERITVLFIGSLLGVKITCFSWDTGS